MDLPVIQSVRSSRRAGPDGQVVFDLVAEVTQRRRVQRDGMTLDVFGGATAIIGPMGEVRYVIAKNVLNTRRLERQLAFVAGAGRRYWALDEGQRLAPRRDFCLALERGRTATEA